nr:hypothetical protein [Tanacetum cinerariifolium]
MLTISYLRQQGLAHERCMEDNVDEKQQSTTIEISQESDGHDTHYMHSHTPLNTRKGLTKSFSIPIIGSSKRRDFELEDIKDKLKDCKEFNKDVGVKHDTEFDNDDIGDHQENNDRQEESSAATNNEVVAKEDNIDHQKKIDRQDNVIHQEDTENQNESRVTIQMENDKSFNEVLGMFKKVSDERTKLNLENESSSLVRKVSKNTTVNKDQRVRKNKEVSEKTLDHHKSDKSPLASDLAVEWSMKDSKHDSSYLPVDKKNMSAADNYMVVNTFLHLDINSVKDNTEFQFVKEVLERSGFLENELLGEWYSSYQPIDPLLFEEVEASFLQTKYLEELDSMKDEEATQRIINDHHILLFD